MADGVGVAFFDGLLLKVCALDCVGFALELLVAVGVAVALSPAFFDGLGVGVAAYDGSAFGSAGGTAIGVNIGTAVTTTLS